jgi:cysteine desulfurase
MQKRPIYLDFNATTPVDLLVLEKMLPFFTENFGNASSNTHSYGWIAGDAVKLAREQVSSLIGCLAQEIIFTSGSTEATNIAIKGVFEAYKSKGNHIVTTKTEHKAVLDVCKALELLGAEITYLDVDSSGLINLYELEKAITDKTILVSIMYANNETGVIQDVKSIAEIIHSKNSIFFCDATQAVGKIPVNVIDAGIDLMTLSAHKMYGPKGVGALYIRRKNPRVTLLPILNGGGHEKGLRPGTLNVPGIVGLGKACEISEKYLRDGDYTEALRNELEKGLLNIKGAKVNGASAVRLPNTCSVTFPDFKSTSIISDMKEIAVSMGSACTSASPEPSHVLQAMGLSEMEIYGTIRISLGRTSTANEIKTVLELFYRFFEHQQ